MGCEHGICGSCTVLMRMPELAEGQGGSDRWAGFEAVRSCLLFASQVDGAELATVEGLAPSDSELHPLQDAFVQRCGLQCGFCTSGFLMTLVPFLRDTPQPSEGEIREALSGNLCRCTGYVNIVKAVSDAARQLREGADREPSGATALG